MAIFKDYLTGEQLAKLGLNPRQIKAVLHAKGNEKITSKEYQEINSVKRATATRDLSELVERYGIFEINQKIMIAELYRNLGKYVECNNILDTIEEGSAWIKEALKNECEKNNRNVIELKLQRRR